MDDITKRLEDRADSYEQSGPSAHHTAALLREASEAIKQMRRDQIGKFTPLLSVGFDKNGDADFRVSSRLFELTFEKMNLLRQMIPVGIAETERMWINHGPPSKEMAQAAAAPRH